MFKPRWKYCCYAVGVLSLALFNGCSVTTKPITQEERSARVQEDWRALFAGSTPINAPISLYEAIARGAKYQLDARVKTMELVLNQKELKSASLEMLPKLLASAGYQGRSNVNAASSESILTHQQSLEPSTSQDNVTHTTDLQFSWNALDLGLSYLTAKQKADQVLITEEERHQVLQNLVRDIRYAYWRAVAAEVLLTNLPQLQHELVDALAIAEQIQAGQLKSPLTTMQYQKSLLSLQAQIQSLAQQLLQAKPELASLMNISPNTEFRVVVPLSLNLKMPAGFDLNDESLDQRALLERPELRAQDYRVRSAMHEITKEKLRLIPGLELLSGVHYDSNSFLVNNSWASYAAQLSLDLMQLVKAPSKIAAAKAGVELEKTKRLALTMAIITQVRLAKLRFLQASKAFNFAEEIKQLDHRIFRQVNQEFIAEKTDRLELIRAKANQIVSMLNYYLSYAEYQNSIGQLLSATGYDPLWKVRSLDQSIAQLTMQIEASLTSLRPQEQLVQNNNNVTKVGG